MKFNILFYFCLIYFIANDANGMKNPLDTLAKDEYSIVQYPKIKSLNRDAFILTNKVQLCMLVISHNKLYVTGVRYFCCDKTAYFEALFKEPIERTRKNMKQFEKIKNCNSLPRKIRNKSIKRIYKIINTEWN